MRSKKNIADDIKNYFLPSSIPLILLEKKPNYPSFTLNVVQSLLQLRHGASRGGGRTKSKEENEAVVFEMEALKSVRWRQQVALTYVCVCVHVYVGVHMRAGYVELHVSKNEIAVTHAHHR